MHLEINGERVIKDIQADFNLAYPYLKIEFFNSAVQYHNYVPQQKTENILPLKNILRNKIIPVSVEITDQMTVTELESIFMQRFGLYAQVFRKSGGIWLETTLTDKWTLKQQNDHGREISQEPVYKSKQAGTDFDLSRDAAH
ncbi:MAG: hypothetical protein QM791_17980 [Ferruginibacter sp.]